jgi:hypothetical protein
MDQTPLAFKFLNSKMYNCKGKKTIWLKQQRSGWDRHQCTLQVCAFTDGKERCVPLLIFYGSEVGDSQRAAEERRYSKSVEVL